MAVKNYTPKGIFIEFLIVILGITIAFWLSNLGEERKEARLEQAYLQDLNTDLIKDQKSLTYSINQNKDKYETLVEAYKYYRSKGPKVPIDSLIGYAQTLGNYFHFTPNDYTYLSLQQSGDFKIIKDRNLKKAMIELYQQYGLVKVEQDNVIDALDRNYFPVLTEKYDMITGEVIEPAYFESAAFKNTIMFSINEISTLIKFYERSLERVNALISETS